MNYVDRTPIIIWSSQTQLNINYGYIGLYAANLYIYILNNCFLAEWKQITWIGWLDQLDERSLL